MVIASFPHSTTAPNGKVDSMLDRLRAHVVEMTPSHAQYILDTQLWDRQRNLRMPHVLYLSSAIERGELWRVVLEFAELPDGTRVLVDGQHRLNALLRSGRTLPAVVIVNRATNDREVARLYASIDRQKTRSMLDALRAYAIVTDTAISLETLSKFSAGVALLSSGFTRDFSQASRSHVSRADQLETWLPEIEAYLGLIRGHQKEMWNLLASRSSVTAVALATLRSQPDMASQFWGGIAADDGLSVGDPRHTLLRWLRATPMRALPNAIVYALYVALAWNHFYAGTSLTKMIVKSKSAPVRILGTPFVGMASDE